MTTWGSQGEGEKRRKKLPTFVVQCIHDEGELLEEIHNILRAALSCDGGCRVEEQSTLPGHLHLRTTHMLLLEEKLGV